MSRLPSPIPRETQREIERIDALLFGDAGGGAAAEPAPSALGAGHLVLVIRELTGLSQRKLARRIGTSQPVLARIETGGRLPRIRTLMRLADATGFELVLGLRRAEAPLPKRVTLEPFAVIGTLRTDPSDGLANFHVLREPGPAETLGWDFSD